MDTPTLEVPKVRCSTDGCQNTREYNKAANGKIYYRLICTTHRRLKYKMKNKHKAGRWLCVKRWRKNVCQLCGWLGPCDMHRKIPGSMGGRYTKDNVIEICPNCHRLEHYTKKDAVGTHAH